jgi:glyoxylase-like metal-dependent hydrolase (beta-lactamase superfamily II)
MILISRLTKTGTFQMTDLGDLPLPELFRNDFVAVYQPRPDLFLLQTRKDVSSSIYLLPGSTSCLLIDTGKSVRDLTSVLRRLTDKLITLVLTHGHHDHVSAIDEFDHLYMHSGDRGMIASYNGSVTDVAAGFQFDLGGRIVEVVDLVGHTPGSIGLLDVTNRLLFTGDAIGGSLCYMQLTPLPLEYLVAVCDRIAGTHGRWVDIWPGHFNQLARVLDLQFVTELRAIAADVIAGKLTGDVTDLGKVRHGLNFDPHIVTRGEISLVFNPSNLTKPTSNDKLFE